MRSERAPGATSNRLPTGTVTFLFTDIEGSTRLLHELGEADYEAALATHRSQLRQAFVRHGGVEVDTQGDAFFYAFAHAPAAASAASEAQTAMADGRIKVRIGLHSGRARLSTEGYVGREVHRGARIAAAGHGGQVVLSRETCELLDDSFELLDLGEHRVKDFDEPVWLFQLGTERFPPLKTISNTNLPRLPSSFIGREREVGELTAMLRDGARLVTLTGPGGTGKTRLAIETGGELVPDFPNGVFWVPLVALRDPRLVTQSIAETIGAKGDPAAYIGERQMLLVLDNLEQIIEAAPDIAALLPRCPNLRLLVTSRELLRVAGEVEYAVPPLAAEEAVELFATRSGLPADGEIRTLCDRLDNLPLAVELAAARTRVLSPRQILERLSSRLDLLKGGRDTDARQQTLRTTIAWSHDLLTPDEQRFFARVAVFRAGCRLETAEAVADADVDLLEALVDKSLLRLVNERFRMLETIREFAAEKLVQSGDLDAIRRRHAEYFLALAEEAEKHVTGPRQQEWWARLTEEIENLRAALEWATGEGGDPAVALRLAIGVGRYWWNRGHYQEGRQWLEHVLAASVREPEALRAKAMYALGDMVLAEGDHAEAKAIYQRILPIFHAEDDDPWTSDVLTSLGIAQVYARELDGARDTFRQCLDLARKMGDQRREGVSFINLAEIEMTEGNLDVADAMQEEALTLLLAAGDEQSAGNVLGNRALLELRRGNIPRAVDYMRRSLVLSRRSDDRFSLAHSLVVAGALIATDDPELGARVFGRVAEMHTEMNIAIGPSEASLLEQTLADLRQRLGDEAFEAAAADGRRLDHEAGLDLVESALTTASAVQ